MTPRQPFASLPLAAPAAFVRGFTSTHNGVDLDLRTGDPLYAVDDGVVGFVLNDRNPDTNASGLAVGLTLDSGVTCSYSHMSRIDVRRGERVRAGQVIGAGGNTGRVRPAPAPGDTETGSHLHFRVDVDGVEVDPLPFLPGARSGVPGAGIAGLVLLGLGAAVLFLR